MGFTTWKVCILLISIAPLLKADECPYFDLQKPCECKDGDEDTISVKCMEAGTHDELTTSLKPMAGIHVTELDIVNSRLYHVSAKSFVDMIVSKISISDSSLYDLFDQALSGKVTSSLKILRLEKVKINDEINWNTLGNLKKLLHLKVINTNLKLLPYSFANISLPTVKTVTLNDDELQYMDGEAFIHFTGMQQLDLKGNLLQKLERDMFPDKAELQVLDLSNNRFKEFSTNTFDKLSYLTTLILINNEFTTMNQDYMKNIFEQVLHFDITNNPIICERRLEWLTKQKPKSEKSGHFFGFCTQASTGNRIELKNLKISDL